MPGMEQKATGLKQVKNPNAITNNFKFAFNVEEKMNQQGLTYNEGVYYIAFNLSNVGYLSHTKIIAYDQLWEET
ncbi:hypothetical protein FZX01_15365 [Listeria monocytogenes]|uniref:hypothetical protein n=1 Tax=Listeria monocytogenes TaxID=1639 RepID=UPI0011EAAD48|nr:hypothetical protein [Listeria monocytogenes]TYU82857.1 hypothetical protein FZX01_15365 [Listeria monocytogenes]